ncbi:MAG: hypothetical protein HW378_4877 [Anaerolineales bacterium]|nr:hypothetical protein [Anaerolineales bacterium]
MGRTVGTVLTSENPHTPHARPTHSCSLRASHAPSAPHSTGGAAISIALAATSPIRAGTPASSVTPDHSHGSTTRTAAQFAPRPSAFPRRTERARRGQIERIQVTMHNSQCTIESACHTCALCSEHSAFLYSPTASFTTVTPSPPSSSFPVSWLFTAGLERRNSRTPCRNLPVPLP